MKEEKFKYCKYISFCKIENKYFIVNETTNKYYLLEGVASIVWQNLESGSFIEICNKIVKIYKIDIKTVISDLTDLINNLLKVKLIERVTI